MERLSSLCKIIICKSLLHCNLSVDINFSLFICWAFSNCKQFQYLNCKMLKKNNRNFSLNAVYSFISHYINVHIHTSTQTPPLLVSHTHVSDEMKSNLLKQFDGYHQSVVLKSYLLITLHQLFELLQHRQITHT